MKLPIPEPKQFHFWSPEVALTLPDTYMKMKGTKLEIQIHL